MIEVKIKDEALRQAAAEGTDAFLQLVHDSILEAAGGEITPEALEQLSADQTTLLAYFIVREEVMNGGFVQLIHNGYGPFIYFNPFGRALRQWGVDGLAKLITKSHGLFVKHREALERDCTFEEFSALYEQHPEFDDFDDTFVEYEEEITEAIANYVDEHLDHFVKVTT